MVRKAATRIRELPERSSIQPALTIRPANAQDINTVLTLHQEAFADKFGSAFGARGLERGKAALARAWTRQGNRALRGMFVAEWQQQVIGTATLRTWEMGDDDGAITESAFQQELGLWGATRSIFVLSLLSHRITQHEGFITDVAVLAPFRRCGVASALLSRLEETARLQHKRYLGLYVSRNNQDAIALYQRTGFCQSHIRRSWMTRLCFGQREWLYMRKDLLFSA
jgi:ribosomal protein S18 acetylase RimI-like enzyme